MIVMKNIMLFAGWVLILSGCQFSKDAQFRDYDEDFYNVPEASAGEDNLKAQSTKTEMQTVNFADIDIAPQVYAIAAARVTNKMLDETEALYFKKEKKPTLNIVAPQKLNDQLPDGFHYANKVTNDIIEGSKDYTLVDNPEEAEYSLQVLINALPYYGSATPIIEYQMMLSDKDGKEVGVWSESIKQLKNDDKSWW